MTRLRPIVFVTVLAALLSVTAGANGSERRVRVAAVSFVPVKLDVAGNAARLENAFRAAAREGAQIAVAPEGAIDGYVINQVLACEIPLDHVNAVALPIDHAIIRRFQALAVELRMCLAFGFAEQIGREIYNTAIFIDDEGRIRGKYHKMQFAEGYHPEWWFNRLGSQSRAFDTPFGRCGILICNDRWNPALARIPALDGAQFLLIPAYGSAAKAQDEAVMSRSRETGLPIIEANVGVSLIVSAGELVALERKPESVTVAEILIPAPVVREPAARDVAEREFLAWREVEMRRRYEASRHKLGSAAHPLTSQ